MWPPFGRWVTWCEMMWDGVGWCEMMWDDARWCEICWTSQVCSQWAAPPKGTSPLGAAPETSTNLVHLEVAWPVDRLQQHQKSVIASSSLTYPINYDNQNYILWVYQVLILLEPNQFYSQASYFRVPGTTKTGRPCLLLSIWMAWLKCWKLMSRP